jgi:hypothetical protein
MDMAQVLLGRAGGRPIVSEFLRRDDRVPRLAAARGVQPPPSLQYLYRSASDATMKYILESSGGAELYDISKDPKEMNNLAEELPQIAETFSAHLAEWVEKTPRFTPDSSDRAKSTPSQLELLRSLGYVGP